MSAHQAEVERPYTALAALLNCQPSNIALMSSATAAWVQVLGMLVCWNCASMLLLAEVRGRFLHAGLLRPAVRGRGPHPDIGH